jgi:hypothetical protein
MYHFVREQAFSKDLSPTGRDITGWDNVPSYENSNQYQNPEGVR